MLWSATLYTNVRCRQKLLTRHIVRIYVDIDPEERIAVELALHLEGSLQSQHERVQLGSVASCCRFASIYQPWRQSYELLATADSASSRIVDTCPANDWLILVDLTIVAAGAIAPERCNEHHRACS